MLTGFEQAYKVAYIIHAAGISDLFHGLVGTPQQLFCIIQAQGDLVFMDILPGVFFEFPGQMVFTNII